MIETGSATGFELRLGGREPVGLVCRLAGIESASAVAEHSEVDALGNPRVRKVQGPARWSDLVVGRPVDDSRVLWEWREAVLRHGADGARIDGSIALLDAAGRELAVFAFVGGWPARYRVVGLDEPFGAVVEEVVICHEGLSRL
jgi:phage tail-like protein